MTVEAFLMLLYYVRGYRKRPEGANHFQFDQGCRHPISSDHRFAFASADGALRPFIEPSDGMENQTDRRGPQCVPDKHKKGGLVHLSPPTDRFSNLSLSKFRF